MHTGILLVILLVGVKSGSKVHHVKFAQVFLDIFFYLSGLIKLMSLIDIMTKLCLSIS